MLVILFIDWVLLSLLDAFLAIHILILLSLYSSLFTDRPNLAELLGEGELLFLHHLSDDLFVDVGNSHEQFRTKDSHFFVHRQSYLFTDQ